MLLRTSCKLSRQGEMAWLTCAVAVILGVHFTSATLDSGSEWAMFKTAFSKSYATAEEEGFRKMIYQSNVKLISEHNSRNVSYRLGMNQFGDWTKEEFARLLGTRAGFKPINGSTFLAPSNVVLPDEVDWRKHGYVTGVKNQGHCGSCWAFSTTGSLEGQHFKKTGRLVSLSEQNLVDCSLSFGNHGCEGGLMDYAFAYIKQNDGIDTEQSYPYTARDGATCKYSKANRGAENTGHVDIPTGDEQALKKAAATVGPISVAIDASHTSFQFYRDGAYNEPTCSSTTLNHGVLVVGYGTLDGEDYWLVKNSWGQMWGMEGYVRMSRNKDNQCGIATAASYPLV